MIPQTTIDLIKSTAKAHEVIGDFIQLKKAGNEFVACCPFHDEKTPSFKVSAVDNFYKCFGCGKSGDPITFLQEYKKLSFSDSIFYLANKYKILVEQEDGIKKEYIRPEWRNNTNLSDKLVKWFADVRKISQATLKIMKVGESQQWMPEHKYKQRDEIKLLPAGTRTVIEFNYFRDGKLINTKYRDAVKSMRMIKDAELCLYNIDSLKGAKEALILEGEGDCLTIAEIGYPHGNVSVPNGANIKSNNMIYLDTAIELFDSIPKILIGTDNDVAGRKLREDLAERLGKERCYYIEWKDCKDANEVLVKYGKEAVCECINNAKEFPIMGAFAPSAFKDKVNDLFANGVDRGKTLGLGKFDDLLRFVPGYLSLITGYPNSGKSDFVDEMALRLITLYGWKGAYYTPENHPTELHITKLARKLIGKAWDGRAKMNDLEKDLAMSFIEDKVTFIIPEKNFTVDSILDTARTLKKRKGINFLVLDAWNRFEHKFSGSEVKYINEALVSIDNACKELNIVCFLVAHPTKPYIDRKGKEDKLPVATMHDISGGAQFNNIIANGMSVYRDYGKFNESLNKYDNQMTLVYVQKVRMQPYHGHQGYCRFKYDIESGRFNEFSGDNAIFDYSNWITKENRPIPINFNYEEPTGIIINNLEDDPF